MNANISGRLIGVQHRRKQNKAGEARPTILVIVDGGDTVTISLETDLAELDFVHGMLPTSCSWRAVIVGEDLSGSQKHHIRFRKPADNETLESILAIWPEPSLDIETKNRGRKNQKQTLHGIPTEVADKFDGLRPNDTIISIFGGSGHNFMQALALKAEKVGAKVYLTAPRNIKTARDLAHQDKEQDAQILVGLFQSRFELFHQIFASDVQSWEVMHHWDMTEQAMNQRKKLIQRAEAAALHTVYVSEEYYGAKLAQAVLDAKMGNQTVKQVLAAEAEAEKELEKAIENHPLCEYLFGDVKGCGPRFFGKVLSAVRDVRRFPRTGIGAFLRFTGYAVERMESGGHTIQRFRRGGGMPGNPEIKQAVWLLIDMQFSRQKNTPWGLRFREIKTKLQEAHPCPLLTCKTDITFGKNDKFDSETGIATIELAKGKFAQIKGKLAFTPAGGDVIEAEPEVIQLQEGKWKVANGLYEIEQPDGTKIYRLGKSKYTKIHLHKITGWKLGTEFLVWVFKRWWQYVDEQEAKRQQAKAA